MDVTVPHVAASLGTPTVFVQIVGSTSNATPGIPITGIVNTDIDAITYAFEESIPTVRTTIGALALATTPFASNSMREVDATNMPGIYRFDFEGIVNDPISSTTIRGSKCTVVITVDSLENAIIEPIHFTIDYGTTSTDAVYVKDDPNSADGTFPELMGTPLYPVDTMVLALSVADATNKQKFILEAGGSQVGFTLSGSGPYVGMTFDSISYGALMNFGGAECDQCTFKNLSVSGVFVATHGVGNVYENCRINSTYAFDGGTFLGCMLKDIHLGPNNNEFRNCYGQPQCVSGLPVKFTFDSASAAFQVFQNLTASVEVFTMGANHTMEFMGGGGSQFTVNVNCTGGTIFLNGQWDLIIDNSLGAVDIVVGQSITSIRDQGIYREQGFGVKAFSWPFAMYDSTTGELKTGLTVTGTVTIDGATPVAVTGAIVEAGGGYYQYTASPADIGGNDLFSHELGFTFSATGAKDASIAFPVMR